jgi:AAA family ATP:ADP antiporter
MPNLPFDASAAPATGPADAWLRRAVEARPGERAALLWAFAYFFCLLCGYYILRPLRDEMGIAGGVRQLPWLFSGTFVAMLAAVPLFSALVARFPRRRFIPYTYRFFVANLLIFFALFQLWEGTPWVARTFFIWTSVFNLFVISVFWSFMADLFGNEQGKRLFGFIAAGGTAGALAGPSLTAGLAGVLGPEKLLLVSALFLEGAVLCVGRLNRWAAARPVGEPRATPADYGGASPSPRAEGAPATAQGDAVIGGGILAGFTRVARSGYLCGIAGFVLLFTTTSTFLYLEQAQIVAESSDDPARRTAIFAAIDLLVNVLTLFIQTTLTGRVIRRFGVAAALTVVPAITAAGFLALAFAPALLVLAPFQGLRRAADYAISRPAREILFTVVPREDKYKSKNFLDTVVYRGGDAASGWLYAGLGALGLGLPALAFVAVPLAALWGLAGFWLGRRQEALRERLAT